MSEKSDDRSNIVNEGNQFDKIVKISLIIGIIVISGFIIYYLLTPEPGYVTFGVLNSDKKAENYPTNATVGENISFYISVGNYLRRDFNFRIEILKGDNNTLLTSSGSINASSYLNTSITNLNHKMQWMSEMFNISFSQPGTNQIMIAELKEVDISLEETFIDILWLRFNITS
ncbi:MAG: DUF1616 domain-containing protein [Candidatus Thorarchaeota archaeon]